MANTVGRRVFYLALAFAVALSTLLAPLGHTGSHDPAALALAGIEHHAAAATKADDHGHSHLDHWPRERHAGHLDGHNPADHDHLTPAPADLQSFAFLRTTDSWDAVPPLSNDHGPYFGIERPPRA